MKRVITADEKARMEKLSIGILDLCDASGLNDGALIANAALIGCAGVVASTLPDNATQEQIEDTAERAGTVLAQEIIKGQVRFQNDMAEVETATRQ